ncbi:GNAT family N-acetyltransferase [Enterococcus malodoratus]|uniref:GNAT family N-acetyltransferase n=1 Tax=Enterococcus malodoratus TaxID=71451 RepID=UPI0030B8A365
MEDQLAGGIVGKRQYDTLHISLLGVDEAYQKFGVGSKLMQAMEKHAVQEQVKTITLTTKAYQALGFYLKQGYEVFGELGDVPMAGTTKYYLAKKISR